MNLLEALARWAWETSIAASLLAVIALAAKFTARKPHFAPIRYTLGLLVVARLLMPIAIPSPFSIFNLFHTEKLTPLTALIAPREPINTAPPPISASTIESPIPRTHTDPLPILWLAVALIILARVLIQQLRIRRSLTATTQISTGPSFDTLEQARQIMGCRRKIRLHAVPGLASPALFGIVRPTILLPSDFAASATQAQLRLVYLHEIAHLRRMDVPINWLMILAQSLHWFNPLVWLTMRRLRAEQEILCDRDVVRILNPEERHAYGETLLALASPRHAPLSTLIPISSGFKQLKERIAMITQFKSAKNRLLLFALPPLAALIAVVTFTAATDRRPPPTQSRSASDESDRRKVGLKILEEQLAVQSGRVQQAEATVDDLRKTLRIPPFNTESELYLAESDNTKRIQTDLMRAKQEYMQFETLQERLRSKPRNELIQMLPTAYRDDVLDRLLQNLASAEQQLASAKTQFGDNHPDVQVAQTLVKTIRQQVEQRTDGILNGLDALVSAREKIVKELTAYLDHAKDSEWNTISAARPYFNAVRDLQSQREFRDSIYRRLLQEKMDSELRPR